MRGGQRWRSAAGRCRRPDVGARRPRIGSRRARRALQLAQPPIEIQIQIALALLRLIEFVGQYFVLAAQFGDVGLDVFDVLQQIHQALALERRLERANALVERALELVDAALEHIDAMARLIVIKYARVRGHAR